MSAELPRRITPTGIILFSFPTIVMMLFVSLYTMVDGLFVSNLVGEDALSAVNIIYPVTSVVIAMGLMLGTGGSAVLGKCLGEGQEKLARGYFSMFVLWGFALGVVLGALGFLLCRPLCLWLGATPALLPYCEAYLRPMMLAAPLCMLQMIFQSYFVTAGRPGLGLAATTAGGCANVVMDYLFMGPLHLGVMGAALGTSFSYAIPAITGLIFFSRSSGPLRFSQPVWDLPTLGHACFNGSSEMVTNLANAVTTLLFNLAMLHFWGENGVAAITIVLYAQFFLSSVYMGYSFGVAPVFSYHYGLNRPDTLKKLFAISMVFVAVNAVFWYALSFLLGGPLIGIFVRPSSPVYAIAMEGWPLFSLAFLPIGFNIFASSLFTALSDGKTSALISFLRTFGFLTASILLLPRLLDSNGIWLSVAAAECCTLAISVPCLVRLVRRWKRA